MAAIVLLECLDGSEGQTRFGCGQLTDERLQETPVRQFLRLLRSLLSLEPCRMQSHFSAADTLPLPEL